MFLKYKFFVILLTITSTLFLFGLNCGDDEPVEIEQPRTTTTSMAGQTNVEKDVGAVADFVGPNETDGHIPVIGAIGVITGTAQDDNGIMSVQIVDAKTDGELFSAQKTAGSETIWYWSCKTPGLTTGDHSLYIRVIDKLGNTVNFTWNKKTVHVDNPQVTLGYYLGQINTDYIYGATSSGMTAVCALKDITGAFRDVAWLDDQQSLPILIDDSEASKGFLGTGELVPNRIIQNQIDMSSGSDDDHFHCYFKEGTDRYNGRFISALELYNETTPSNYQGVYLLISEQGNFKDTSEIIKLPLTNTCMNAAGIPNYTYSDAIVLYHFPGTTQQSVIEGMVKDGNGNLFLAMGYEGVYRIDVENPTITPIEYNSFSGVNLDPNDYVENITSFDYETYYITVRYNYLDTYQDKIIVWNPSAGTSSKYEVNTTDLNNLFRNTTFFDNLTEDYVIFSEVIPASEKLDSNDFDTDARTLFLLSYGIWKGSSAVSGFLALYDADTNTLSSYAGVPGQPAGDLPYESPGELTQFYGLSSQFETGSAMFGVGDLLAELIELTCPLFTGLTPGTS